MIILGIDIGGTSVKYGLYNKEENKYGDIKSFTTRDIEKDDLILELGKVINKINPDIISISSPGAIIADEYVSGLTGIKNYSNFNLKEELLSNLQNKKVKILLLNDANAALMSEMNKEKEKMDIALISIGTGIGGAIALKGKLRTGNRGLAGEFGYGIVNKEKNVSLASSSRSIETNYKNKFNIDKTTKEIIEEYNKDKKCKEIIDHAVEQNAINIFNLFYILDIDLFIISGGITNQKIFTDKISKRANELSKQRGSGANIKIERAKHLSEAGLRGAINFALINE